MIADFLADFFARLLAVATTPSPAPLSTHDAYEWWSDIWLPALVGLGSIGIAAVAAVVASRSNRLARAATKAAERSNAIAKRALEHEQRETLQTAELRAAERRQTYASRFLSMVDRMAEELTNDPTLWDRPIVDTDFKSFLELGPLTMEGSARGFSDFPDDFVIDAMRKAAQAGGERGRMLIAQTVAHLLIENWVEDPSSSERMVPAWRARFDRLMVDPTIELGE